MDQLALFTSPEENAYIKLKPRLEEVLDKNWADHSLLSFEKRQSYYSVMFDGSVVMRLRGGKQPYIELSNFRNVLPGMSQRANYVKIKLEDLDQIDNYYSYIEGALQALIDAIPKEYSCCSRYMECSDKNSCTNPNKDMAMRCGYRKVLMSGKVFFGKNRNID